VGGVYDASRHRYDHHQRTFTDTMRTVAHIPFDTKLSSAGLVYAHFGKQVISQLLHIDETTNVTQQTNIELMFERVYEQFIEEIDGTDNGVEPYDGRPRYKLTTSISSRVGRLLPPWNAPKPVDLDALFRDAMKLIGGEFVERVHFMHAVFLPAYDIVRDAYDKRFDVDKSGHIMLVESGGGVPWEEHLFTIEDSDPSPSPVLYVLRAGDKADDWRVQCTSLSKLEPFANKHALPAEWRGLRDSALATVAGIEGAHFVHATGFLGGARTKDAVYAMAKRACETWKACLHVH